MKYNFFCREIGKLKKETLLMLKEYAVSVEYKNNSGYFHKEILKTHSMALDLPIVDIIKNELSQVLNKNLIKRAMINMLPAAKHVPEHSDVGPKSFHQDDLIIHKIHIPIITNQYCSHIWTLDQIAGDVYAKHMEEGSVYLFNNVTPHGAINASLIDDRYHLILRYDSGAINDY